MYLKPVLKVLYIKNKEIIMAEGGNTSEIAELGFQFLENCAIYMGCI